MPRIHSLCSPLLLFAFFALLLAPFAFSQAPHTPSNPGMEMSASASSDNGTTAAKLLADKQESEFNHRLTGFFVICAGMLILAESSLVKRWRWVRYAWPLCFLAAGLFVLVYSDTEMWPFGPQMPWFAITHNLEDLQHKLFALILVGLGYIELQRARRRLTAVWSSWFFPLAAMGGAVLLIFHVHNGNMRAPHAMQTMEHIQEQHRWFAATGFAIGLSSLAARMPHKWQRFFNAAWPTFLILLGVLLTLYTE